MNESSKTIIRLVLNTLDQITVGGKKNIDSLLGCILALEGLLADGKEDVNNGESDG